MVEAETSAKHTFAWILWAKATQNEELFSFLGLETRFPLVLPLQSQHLLLELPCEVRITCFSVAQRKKQGLGRGKTVSG